jgi:hypothetical protein
VNIPQVVESLYFSPSGMSVHFISCRKDKIRAVRIKIRAVGNPSGYIPRFSDKKLYSSAVVCSDWCSLQDGTLRSAIRSKLY